MTWKKTLQKQNRQKQQEANVQELKAQLMEAHNTIVFLDGLMTLVCLRYVNQRFTVEDRKQLFAQSEGVDISKGVEKDGSWFFNVNQSKRIIGAADNKESIIALPHSH